MNCTRCFVIECYYIVSVRKINKIRWEDHLHCEHPPIVESLKYKFGDEMPSSKHYYLHALNIPVRCRNYTAARHILQTIPRIVIVICLWG